MRSARLTAAIAPLLLLLLLSAGLPAQAQDNDPGYEAAVALLAQTTRPARDGRHHQLLLSLRHLRDPELLPLYDALAASPYAPQRVHGLLGQAEVSPGQRIALATIAEVEDTAEMVELLGVSIDDGLLDAATLAQVLSWEGIDEASRLALAVRVEAGGVAVNDALLRGALLVEDAEPNVGELLRHGLAALLLLQRSDPVARAQLDRMNELGTERDRDAARAQVLEVGHRHGFEAVGPWALSIAEDPEADPQLRLLALRTSLRFLAKGHGPEALELWEQMFNNAEGQAQRVRLALIALEASPWADPALFRQLVNHEDTYLLRIGQAGRAVAANEPGLEAAVITLIEFGHPLGVQWATRYARDFPGPERYKILMAVIAGYDQGTEQSRARLMNLAVDAVQTLTEQDAALAKDLLLPILRESEPAAARGVVTRRHLILLGLVRSRDAEVVSIAESLPDPPDADARDMTLLLRARWGVALSPDDWERSAQVVAGRTSLDDSLRVQLAWAYVKHLGRAGQAIREAVTLGR